MRQPIMIRYEIVPNPFTGRYRLRARATGTTRTADLAADVERASGMPRAAVLAVLRALGSCVGDRLLRGETVTLDDLATFSVSLTGETAAPPREHTHPMKSARVRATARIAPALNRRLREEATFRRIDAVLAGPRLVAVSVLSAADDGLLRPHAALRLSGARLTPRPDQPDEGVFLIDRETGEELPCPWHRERRSPLVAAVPPGVRPGASYTLVVRARPERSPRLMETAAPEPLTAAEA